MKQAYMVYSTAFIKTGSMKLFSFVLANSLPEAIEQGVHNLLKTPNLDIISMGETFATLIPKELVVAAAEELQK